MIAVGSVYSRHDGAMVRVDLVKDGEVYFVSWLPGQEYGDAKRKPVEEFEALLPVEGLTLETQS